MYRFLGRGVLIFSLIIFTGIAVLAQKDKTKDKEKERSGPLSCQEQSWYSERMIVSCEMREQTLALSGGPIAIDGRENGGVSVKGWDQNQVLVRARVRTGAETAEEAAALVKQIRVETGGAKIFATGPETRMFYRWDVSFEVFVPRRADVSVETKNGGIVIADVNGRLDFNAMNGGVVLRRVGGAVRGSTMNGGLVVELSGDRWDGDSLDVSTTNGGIVMSVPENYSAHLETGTINGSISVDFPVTVEGRITKQLALNLGSGGALVKVTTTNGGVHLKRATANE